MFWNGYTDLQFLHEQLSTASPEEQIPTQQIAVADAVTQRNFAATEHFLNDKLVTVSVTHGAFKTKFSPKSSAQVESCVAHSVRHNSGGLKPKGKKPSSQATQDVGRNTLFNDPSPFNELNGDHAGGFASMHLQQKPMRFL